MAVSERALPYFDRLLEDRELRRDIREAISALRGGYKRAERKRRRPSRLLDDKRFKANAERAAASLKDAGARLSGEKPRRHRGRKIVLVLLVLGGAALAAKQVLGEDYSGQPPPAA
ncbi:MAG: hypothetical protein ACRDKV_10175 [Solirubrobacterales bacterium]